MNDEEEILQLKELYDELWHDAKTMIRDMRQSISMYQFSGFLLLLFSVFYAFIIINSLVKVLGGSTSFVDYFGAFFGVFGTAFLILYGIKLLRWYYKLKHRYDKLLKMEEKIED